MNEHDLPDDERRVLHRARREGVPIGSVNRAKWCNAAMDTIDAAIEYDRLQTYEAPPAIIDASHKHLEKCCTRFALADYALGCVASEVLACEFDDCSLGILQCARGLIRARSRGWLAMQAKSVAVMRLCVQQLQAERHGTYCDGEPAECD